MSPGLSYPLAGSSFRLIGPFIFFATRYIISILHGSRMVLHLSGSHFLTSGNFLLLLHRVNKPLSSIVLHTVSLFR